MKSAIGGVSLFQIVIVFVLLFTGFICLSINQSKAYNVKDQIIKAIERENGIDLTKDITSGNNKAMETIIDYLSAVSFRTTGICPSDDENLMYVGYNREGRIDSKNPVFCIAEINFSKGITQQSSELPSMSYYKVVVFFQLDLPVFKSAFGFRTIGETKTLYS